MPIFIHGVHLGGNTHSHHNRTNTDDYAVSTEIAKQFAEEEANRIAADLAFEAKMNAALIEAVKTGDIAAIQNYLFNITEVVDADQNNLVMLSVLYGQLAVFKHLLSEKPNRFRYADHLFDDGPSWDLENRKNKGNETVVTLTCKMEGSLKTQFTQVINDRSFFRTAAATTENVKIIKAKIKTQCCQMM